MGNLDQLVLMERSAARESCDADLSHQLLLRFHGLNPGCTCTSSITDYSTQTAASTTAGILAEVAEVAEVGGVGDRHTSSRGLYRRHLPAPVMSSCFSEGSESCSSLKRRRELSTMVKYKPNG